MMDARHGGNPSALSPAQQQEAADLWEAGELTGTQIGARFGVSKSTIIGLAHRRGWLPRGVALGAGVTTIFDRMDALEAAFNAVLRENPPGKGRVKESAAEVRAQSHQNYRVSSA